MVMYIKELTILIEPILLKCIDGVETVDAI